MRLIKVKVSSHGTSIFYPAVTTIIFLAIVDYLHVDFTKRKELFGYLLPMENLSALVHSLVLSSFLS